MSQTQIIAGDATTGLVQQAGDDGTLIIKTGAAGSKVNALTFAADGAPTFLKTPNVAELPSMIRVQGANGYGSTNPKIRRFTTVITNQGDDVTYTDSATLGGYFTIITSDVYGVSYTDGFTSGENMGISMNSTQLTTDFHSITNADKLVGVTTSSAGGMSCAATWAYLPAGTVLRGHTTGVAFSGVALPTFTITRRG